MSESGAAQPHLLAGAFLEARRAAGDPPRSDTSLAALEDDLRRAWSAAREAWPDLDLPAAHFAAHLGRVAPAGSHALHLATSDLYLACAALGGDQRALGLFESHAFREIDAAGAALRASAADLEEVKQIVRTQLFVPDGDRPPAIAEYAGRGSLRGWVRVIATRELLRMRRRVGRELPLEDHILHVVDDGDPDLERLKQLYRSQVADALRDAIGRLEVRERLLLRYHLCDHLSIDEIGAIYQVHRATAARWLGKARETLLELTRQRVAILLSVDPGETDSILRLVRSQLEVSLERHLREDA